MGKDGITWDEARSLFEPDGSLRDLYVSGTSREDWERLLAALKASEWRLQLARDGVRVALPESLAEYLDVSPERPGGMLSIFLGSVRVNAHMFADEEMELDIDPGEVTDAERFADVVRFMNFVADTVRKPIVLTPEGSSMFPLLIARPGVAGVAAGSSWVR